MSNLFVLIETAEGKLTPHALQTIGYAVELARKINQPCYGMAIEADDHLLSVLSTYGISKLFSLTDVHEADSVAFVGTMLQALGDAQASTIVMPHGFLSKVVAPQLAVSWNAALASACVSLPTVESGTTWTVDRMIFSGKAKQTLRLKTEKKVLTLVANAFALPVSVTPVATEKVVIKGVLSDHAVQVVATEKVSSERPSLTEASMVVSGGMGMQSPDNWKWIEALADRMGAAVACTRLVSDAHWRPHHEHVGQTGTTIAPELYIAIGISGAMQHIAGVNQSKIIVAINTDAEAPIFKVADYGIVGDALQVLPKLVAKLS